MKQHPKYIDPAPCKAFASEVKAESESRKISFYAASFGTVDSDSDMLIKGCFAKSINEHGPESQSNQKIAYLWQHDMKEPIGRITKLVEDDKGLYVEAILDEIEEADRVLKQYQSGTLNQHSIGYRYIWDKVEYDEEEEIFIVKEVRLFEVSVVTIGANEFTPFTGMKSEELSSEAAKLNQEVNDLTKSLDHALAYRVRQLISKSIALTLAKSEPSKELIKSETVNKFDWDAAAKSLKK